MKEITVTIRDEMSMLATIAEALGGAGVNIEAISAETMDGKAVIRIITNDSRSATRALAHLPKIKISEAETIVVRLPNRPGELGKIARKLSKYRINLESLYIVSKERDHTDVAIKPVKEHMEKAKGVLGRVVGH